VYKRQLVVASNAWMQNPVGIDLLRTNPETVNIGALLFTNPVWVMMTIHSTISTYAATGFAVAGVYAWGALRGRQDEMRRTAVAIALTVGAVAAVLMPITGDMSAKQVAVREPIKLAAMESQFTTEKRAPLRIGGLPDVAGKRVPLALEIPGGLSWMAFGDRNAEVAGLDRVPQADWPNVPVVHVAFQVMVGAGTAMLLVAAIYWWRRRRSPAGAEGPWLLRTLVAASPLGFIALEAGWIVSEVGRQPWIILGVMRTAEAVTPAAGLLMSLSGFVVLYVLLGVVLVSLLTRLRHA